MTVYTYNRDDVLELLEVAGSIGNLSANLKLSYLTVQRLASGVNQYPNRNTVNKIKPYALGFIPIRQLVRPYTKKDPEETTPES